MAASVISFTNKKSKVAVVRSVRDNAIYIGDKQIPYAAVNPTREKFNQFWALMETVEKHGYLRAAMSVLGRTAIGAWWTLVRHEEFGKDAPDRHRKRLYAFYTMPVRSWDNIKDFQGIAFKILIAVQYLRFFGQAAFQILRDQNNTPVGLDFLPGFIVPNVEVDGSFKKDEAAFIQYPSYDYSYKVEFKSPKDIVFITNPDWEGSPLGGSEIEALTEWALPLDMYLQTAARDYMKNRNRPEVVFSLPEDTSDEAFDEFVKEVEARWSGPTNVGRNPIAIQGDFKVTELQKLPDSLPYQAARKDTREEELAVAGVSGAKLGLSELLTAANIRELRREFHETNLVPLFRLVEQALYEQIHVREFGFPGWEFKFKTPDFLTAVEKATVHMRYQQMGAMNPNEIRQDLGMPKRKDPGGDEYASGKSGGSPIGQQPTAPTPAPNPQGNPPEGRPIEPDAPSQIGEPTDTNQDPERGDQHDEQPKAMIEELQRWKEFARRRLKRGRVLRDYQSEILPVDLRQLIMESLRQATTTEEVATIFDEAIQSVKEVFGAEI